MYYNSILLFVLFVWGYILAITVTHLDLMSSVIDLLFLDQKLVHMITIYLVYHCIWYDSEQRKEKSVFPVRNLSNICYYLVSFLEMPVKISCAHLQE